MRLVKEFSEFALRGNVIDLAVGVIIGAAFGRIVNSLVEDILLPPIGKIVGNMDFTNLYIPLYELPDQIAVYPKTLADAKKLGSVIAYGNFITVAINFVIVALCIFVIVKLMNIAKARFERDNAASTAAAAPSKQEQLLAEIRDLLANQRS